MTPTGASPTQPKLAAIDERAPIARLARFVLAHRRLVMVAWLVVFLAGAAGASHVSKRLSVDFSLPGQPGYETAQKITHTYGNGGEEPPSIAVITVPAGQTVAGERAQIAAALGKVHAALPLVRVVDFANTGDPRMITSDGRTTYAYLFSPIERTFGAPKIPQRAEQILRAALPTGTQTNLTGLLQLSNSEESGSGPGVFLETVFGGLGALAVLAFVFASLLAFLPLLIAAVAILSTLLVILALTYIADVSFIVQFLVSLVGLGVAIDYSLLIVTRWREERAHGRENHEAVVAAMATAGRAVRALWLDRSDRPDRADRAARPGAALGGLRRHADPTGLDARRADAAAGDAGRYRAARGLAAHPPREPRQPWLDRVDAHDRAPPLDRGSGGGRNPGAADRAVLQPHDRRNQRQCTGAHGTSARSLRTAARRRRRKRRADADRSADPLHSGRHRARAAGSDSRDVRRAALERPRQQPRRNERAHRHTRRSRP